MHVINVRVQLLIAILLICSFPTRASVSELCDGKMPSDAADKQMLQTDAQRVAERHDEVSGLIEKADKLLADAQPALAATRAGDGDDADAPSEAMDQIKQAWDLYHEAIKKAPRVCAQHPSSTHRPWRSDWPARQRPTSRQM